MPELVAVPVPFAVPELVPVPVPFAVPLLVPVDVVLVGELKVTVATWPNVSDVALPPVQPTYA